MKIRFYASRTHMWQFSVGIDHAGAFVQIWKLYLELGRTPR